MKIELYEEEVKKLEEAGLVSLDYDAEDYDISFEKIEDKNVWRMYIHHGMYDLDVYVHTQLIVPEAMVKQYVEAAGGVFEQ